MIVCPNCNHQNPDGAIQCEACLTPLPAMTTCPNCGASVQTDATFCGQCGFNLRANLAASQEQSASSAYIPPTVVAAPPAAPSVSVPPLTSGAQSGAGTPAAASVPPASVSPPVAQQPTSAPPPPQTLTPTAVAPTPQPAPPRNPSKTQLQVQVAKLRHVQTNTELELPQHLSVIHIGKPNDLVPPDIDVSGFPNSEIVSRVHADIRVEGDCYYIEDTGSSNGTYINNQPLGRGNRHRLRPGDRIALGKGDLVTFVFHMS
ncbi:MAG: FHA domain-containing protein [Oscillatoriaceae bacterium SKYG93]|nr:FHA domain-containing protein [Oscillatoriaceae bacterium SKYG93]MDW8452130.1 FHA domain-containing protein [Oscillatoriaceae cyanobacterium SKYGB_i_bin93]